MQTFFTYIQKVATHYFFESTFILHKLLNIRFNHWLHIKCLDFVLQEEGTYIPSKKNQYLETWIFADNLIIFLQQNHCFPIIYNIQWQFACHNSSSVTLYLCSRARHVSAMTVALVKYAGFSAPGRLSYVQS
jgi:hypothetical protein